MQQRIIQTLVLGCEPLSCPHPPIPCQPKLLKHQQLPLLSKPELLTLNYLTHSISAKVVESLTTTFSIYAEVIGPSTPPYFTTTITTIVEPPLITNATFVKGVAHIHGRW